MFESLIQKKKPEPVTPKGFVKVTNRRKGRIVLPVAPFAILPGVTYHDEKHFNEMPQNVVEALGAHMRDGELSFEAADVPAPPKPDVTVVGEPPPVLAPALSADPAEALTQIEAQTDVSVLSAWFDTVPPAPVSDAILARLTSLNPA